MKSFFWYTNSILRMKMNIFERIYWIFSLFTDPQEKKVGKFFESIFTQNSPAYIHNELQKLMQEDLIRLNLYQEYKFKGYKNLSKMKRKKLYANADLLTFSFENYVAASPHIPIPKEIQKLNVSNEKKHFLSCILRFLSPQRHYTYEKSAAFSKLLRNPEKEKLVGDCNQICTLYLALYSTKFPIDDFKVHILPDHVCLRYEDIDIEATSASITKYENGKILPITEMISTNMLDISDASEKSQIIAPANFAKAAKCVFLISSEREIATRNLHIAYHNLGIKALKENQFEKAYSYFQQANMHEQAQTIWQNATKYYLDQKNFSTALKYAKKSGQQSLQNIVIHNHALYLIKQKSYSSAESKLQSIRDQKSLLFLWQTQLQELNKTLQYCKTIKDFKSKKSTLKKMKSIAYKSKNQGIIEFCDNILKQI